MINTNNLNRTINSTDQAVPTQATTNQETPNTEDQNPTIVVHRLVNIRGTTMSLRVYPLENNHSLLSRQILSSSYLNDSLFFDK